MRALITNDDGIDAPGLVVLARAAVGLGFEVVVAAPSWDSSGASASLTAVLRDGRFGVQVHPLPGVQARSLAVDAAPAYIVRAAVGGAFGPAPDVVLSGVNLGLNAGRAVVHSGTVGAITTASTYDTGGIAFSADAPGVRWDAADLVVVQVLRWLRDGRPSAPLLNVNVPAVDPADLGELRSADLAPFGAVTTTVTDVDEGSVLLHHGAPAGAVPPGTDVALLRCGHPTVTALRSVCEDAAPAALSGLVAAGSVVAR